MKSILLTSTFFIAASVFAQEGQNLVPNGSFEEISKAPRRTGSIESANGWVSPTGVRADLFVDSKYEEISVPFNMYGKEEPKDGENYAGIYTYSFGKKVPRSYIMTKMNAPMKKGLKYCVEFYVSLSEASKFANNNIAVKFSNRAFGTDTKLPIYDDPSILKFDNEAITARYNWVKICGTYVADGGEKYITLGNFSSDEETTYERMKKEKRSEVKVDEVAAAYYYIDNISVFLIDEEKDQTCDCGTGEELVEYSTTVYHKDVYYEDDMTSKEKIEINNLYFAFGKDVISPEGKMALDMIAEIMKENPDMKIELTGHNNASEDEVALENDYYEDMDMKRIGSTMKYLMDKGISDSKILFVQAGSDSPSQDISEDDDDDIKMAKSRRVTFKVR